MLTLEKISKTYQRRGALVTAAQKISFELAAGDFAVIHGPSGSGKSTLLMMMGGLLPPEGGVVRFEGQDIYRWLPQRRNHYRKRSVGFIFQRFHLMPYLSVYDNIRLTLALQCCPREKELIEEVTQRLGLAQRLQHRSKELSVGEQQRVAIARAIIGDKQLILADEPTGNLDEENVKLVGEVLQQEQERGRAVVLVTHNPMLMDLGNRRFLLEDGNLNSL